MPEYGISMRLFSRVKTESVLIWDNFDQGKPLFSHILRSVKPLYLARILLNANYKMLVLGKVLRNQNY